MRQYSVKKHGLFFAKKYLMMRRYLDTEIILKKIVDFLYRKSKIRGAPIMEIIYGDFSNKLKMGRSPDIEIIFRKIFRHFFEKKLKMGRSPYFETIFSKKPWIFLIKKI